MVGGFDLKNAAKPLAICLVYLALAIYLVDGWLLNSAALLATNLGYTSEALDAFQMIIYIFIYLFILLNVLTNSSRPY